MLFNHIHVVRKLNAPHSEQVNRVVAKLESLAAKYNLAVLPNKEECNEHTLVIAVGGDGTMLEAMRISAERKSIALGVNLGNVGFLTDFSEFSPNSVVTIMRNIFEHHADSVYLEERVMVSAAADLDDWHVSAGNEITISRGESDATLSYRLWIDDHCAGEHRANSLIVATPTGSTAYSLSAGGSLMMPSMKALQIVPVAPMTMTSRPIIVGERSKITVDAWGGDLAIRADGVERHVYEQSFTKDRPFRLDLSISDSPVRILHNVSWDFFDVLSSKLGWIKR